jgi:hypothetical protein
MVIAEVLGQNVAKMILVQHDQVVQALAANRTDQPFDLRRLPRRTECDHHFFDLHTLDSVTEVLAVDAIAISQQKPWNLLEGKRVFGRDKPLMIPSPAS